MKNVGNEMFCVYKHTFPNGKVYIGITSQKPEYRWDNGNGYKTQKHFYNAIKKFGWDNIKHEILYSGLTKEEACNKEVELIELYKSNNQEYGYNKAFGGEVNKGYNVVFSDEHNKKLSIAKTQNLSGMRFGLLTAIEIVGRDAKRRSPIWLCRCDCGGTKEVKAQDLLQERVKSCGCLVKETSKQNGSKCVKIKVGMKFGKLTVVKQEESDKCGTRWLCQCECGNTKVVRSSNLLRGYTKSCGCMMGKRSL